MMVGTVNKVLMLIRVVGTSIQKPLIDRTEAPMGAHSLTISKSSEFLRHSSRCAATSAEATPKPRPTR